MEYSFLEERIDLIIIFNLIQWVSKNCGCIWVYKKLIEKVFSVFPDTTGNRIAFNGKILLNEMTDEEIDRFMNEFSSPISIYKDKNWQNGRSDLILENKFHGIIIVRNVIVYRNFKDY